MTKISQPPILNGSEGQQLVQIRQYLYQMSRDLNFALNNLTEGNFATGSMAHKVINGGDTEGQLGTKAKNQLSALKSLIIKTADTVRAEIDRIETNLSSTYVAQSDFSTFTESINTQLTGTAEKLEQNIKYSATLEDNLQSVSDDFDRYVIETGGYIKQGIIGYDGAVPIIGIAIGQDIKVIGTDTKNGKEYEIIDTSSNMSVWTPSKLAFYVNGMEAACVSNGAFYVADMYVLNRLFLGQNRWQISTDRGLTIKWIGG